MRALPAASLGFADLATNVLAIVVAALLLVLSLPLDQPGGSPGGVDEAPAVRRAPLAPAAMVAHLAARRAASGETSLDLRADGLTVAGPAATVAVTPGDAAALLAAVGRPTGPIRLDVFSNRHYAFAATTLAGAGLPFTELSVPAALRSADGRTWSAGFEQLAAGATNPGEFRAGLASLLAARDGPPTTGPGTASMPSSPRATLDRIAAKASAAIAVAALVLAAGVIAFTEVRQLRVRR